MGGLSRKLLFALVVLFALGAVPAYADFPYGSGAEYKLAPGQVPNDYSQDDNDWKFAATAESGSPFASDPMELFGVRGAHVVDPNASVDTAWQTTVGRPDVTISVLDSGIRWDEQGTMLDLRKKIRLNKGELPTPQTSGPGLEGANCASYGNPSDPNDANNDGVFNVLDYLCDPRVSTNEPNSVGPTDLLDPQDLIIAFENGTDEDGNGFTDDIAGWDFLDNDNDAYDDVHYGHGTGEAKDSSAEANNPAGQAGACPNCMVVPLRVGDSFVADVNNFAQAVLYAVDNNVLVVQEALGTLNNSHLAREAIDYAYGHGVTVIASAADEAAQHHNWPSNNPHVIVVNSVNQYDLAATPTRPSYLQLNGCTNFSTHVTVAIPSSSCSSNATGLGAGMAGLIVSAALNAQDAGALTPNPNCERYNGDPCVITPNEVRQLMASGTIDAADQADDVNFATQPEPSCSPAPTPGCTDPNSLFADVSVNRPEPSPIATTKSYPARKGFDEFYGYGRVNMVKAIEAARQGLIPPEAELTSPEWYTQIDPSNPSIDVRGQVYGHGHTYSCKVYVAPGSEPNNGLASDTPPGDFEQVSSNWCDGNNHSAPFDGSLASIDVSQLKARFPADTLNFDGREPPPGAPNFNGRPNTEPYGFTVRVIVSSTHGGHTLTGQDRRNLYLHRDKDMLPGFPKKLSSDGAASPVLVDLDGDNQNELVFGTSDGFVHALRRDGSELPGWPVHTDSMELHTGGHAFTSNLVDANASYAAVLASPAVADLEHDGTSEVVAADLKGKVYAWNANGSLRWEREANPAFSGKPLQPHVNVRQGNRYRTQHGFIASPVIADLDGDGGNAEVIAAGMDRHVYAWHAGGTAVDGFPVLVVDPTKISGVDPQTDAPTFTANAGPVLNQGAIIDTPTVGDLDGDGKPDIVVGTNEEYAADTGNEGPYNAANFNAASVSLISQLGGINFGGVDNPLGGLANVNSRIYAIQHDGNQHAGGPFLPGWPAKVGLLEAELLPVVGEGITGAPVMAPLVCANGGSGNTVGVMGDGGPAYIFNRNGQSCYGQQSGKDIALQTDFAAGAGKFDTPAIPAVGHPIFANLGGTISLVAPATGLIRAFDIVANEYQGGQDFIAAWDATTGQFRPGWPAPTNDLSFITGPSVGDIDGLPGEETLGGTASLDTYGFNAAGAPLSADWPKLSGDWSVADPAIGSFGTQDTDASAHKVVVTLTRSGVVSVYNTAAGACTAGSWPKFHHDNANSGYYFRDATLPGKPYGLSVDTAGTTLTFKAPGGDLLCGTATQYQVAQSNAPITGANFASAEQLSGAPAPGAPGATQTFAIPPDHKRFVAIRAVDGQGNVGPPASVDLPSYARPKGATPFRVPLAIAFRNCTSPGSQHGAPLAFPSCNPPVQESTQLTVGTPDANGKAANGTGFVRFGVQPGDPATPANEADVQVSSTITDIRRQGTLADYSGELRVEPSVRITDRSNGPSQDQAGTVEDNPFPMTVPCAATADTTVGSTCTLTSSFNAIVPGAVVEGKRAIWELNEIDVFDGGADGLAGTIPNTLFERQGIFIP